MTLSTTLYILLAAVIALVLVLLQYFFVKKNKRPKHWIIFSALRFITYFSVLLLLINPKFTNTTYELIKPDLAIAVDNSSSIEKLEGKENVLSVINQLQNDEELSEKFKIETFTFGNEFQQNDSITFTESQSQPQSVFSNLGQLYKNKNAPTLFITDGNQTLGNDYVFSAKNYPQDLFPVVVGDTAQVADLKIEKLNANKYAFLNNRFPVEAFINYSGKKSVSQRFEIKQGNQVIFSKDLEFDAEKNSAIINTKLLAGSVGVKTYSASIQALEGEKNTTNNTKNFAVEVIDEKTNVLVLYETLHPDLGMLQKSFQQNQQRSVTLKKVDESVEWSNYQLVILYQPMANFLAAFQQIEKWGLNTLTITGTQTDYNFLNNQQDFFSKQFTGQQEDYLAAYNSNFSAFQFEDIGFDDFPPLKDRFGELSTNNGLQILLYQSVQGFVSESPLLATAEQNGTKHGYLFGENSWQWRAKSYRDTQSFESFDNFLGKLIQYLSSNKRRERLQLDYQSFYNSGEQIILKAQYFDNNYQFDPRAKLSIQIKNETNNEVQNFPLVLKNNYYQVELSNLMPSTYSFSLKVEGQPLTKTGSFTIIEYDAEAQFSSANFKSLQQLNDRVYFLNEFEDIKNELLNNPKFKPLQKAQKQVSPLIDWVYLLVIIVICLSSEWFLRKYNGLI